MLKRLTTAIAVLFAAAGVFVFLTSWTGGGRLPVGIPTAHAQTPATTIQWEYASVVWQASSSDTQLYWDDVDGQRFASDFKELAEKVGIKISQYTPMAFLNAVTAQGWELLAHSRSSDVYTISREGYLPQVTSAPANVWTLRRTKR